MKTKLEQVKVLAKVEQKAAERAYKEAVDGLAGPGKLSGEYLQRVADYGVKRDFYDEIVGAVARIEASNNQAEEAARFVGRMDSDCDHYVREAFKPLSSGIISDIRRLRGEMYYRKWRGEGLRLVTWRDAFCEIEPE